MVPTIKKFPYKTANDYYIGGVISLFLNIVIRRKNNFLILAIDECLNIMYFRTAS